MFLFPSTVAFVCFLGIFVFWTITEVSVLKKSTTKSERVSERAYRNNQFILYGTTTVMIVMLLLFVTNSFFSTFMMVSNASVSLIGSGIALFGIMMRKKAISVLNKHFDGYIQIKENQELIRHGMYRYLRHPSYTGSIIAFFGLGLASLNLISFVLLPTFLYIAYKERIQIEEEVLLEGFGDVYSEYQQETWQLFPFGSRMKRQKSV